MLTTDYYNLLNIFPMYLVKYHKCVTWLLKIVIFVYFPQRSLTVTTNKGLNGTEGTNVSSHASAITVIGHGTTEATNTGNNITQTTNFGHNITEDADYNVGHNVTKDSFDHSTAEGTDVAHSNHTSCTDGSSMKELHIMHLFSWGSFVGVDFHAKRSSEMFLHNYCLTLKT